MDSNQHILKFFADYIYKQLGIVYHEANYYQLESRLKDIAKQMDFDSIEVLYNNAKKGIASQLRLLILDLATNNETSFFRDPHVFKMIKQYLIDRIPEFVASKRTFQIWCAACSYGQEVYSLAMILDELQQQYSGFRYQILATDISERALKSAENGDYTQLQIQRGLPATKLVKYFEQRQGDYAWGVKPVLKSHVTFKKLNLIEPFGSLGMFDLITCRNVLIYQNVENKKTIIERMYGRINDKGGFVLGTAESLFGLFDGFEMKRFEKATMYVKNSEQSKKAS